MTEHQTPPHTDELVAPASAPRTLQAAVAAVLALTAAGLAAVAPPSHGGGAPAPSPLPVETSRCGSPDARAGRGREALEEARAHMARYPFAPEEGPRALARAGEAETCLAGVDNQEARTAGALRKRWLDRVGRDYAAARIRLSRALDGHHHQDARQEISTLTRLLAAHDDPYTAWLRRLDRSLPTGAPR